MKHLEMSALQRIRASLILEQRGPQTEVRVWIKILDKIELGEAERKLANYRVEQATGIVRWDSLDGIVPKKIALEDTEAETLAKRLNIFEPTPSEFRTWYEPLLNNLT